MERIVVPPDAKCLMSLDSCTPPLGTSYPLSQTLLRSVQTAGTLHQLGPRAETRPALAFPADSSTPATMISNCGVRQTAPGWLHVPLHAGSLRECVYQIIFEIRHEDFMRTENVRGH
jgi:hypothetical protein